MKTLEGTVTVLNAPDYAEGKYIVATASMGELWFYGAWDDEETAIRVAKEYDKVVVRG